MDQHEQNSDAATLIEQIKASSLNLAGAGYLLGDAALFAHGIYNKQYGTAFTGAAWGVGGLVTALYGNEGAEHQLSRIASELGKHLQQQGITIPADSQLHRDFLSKNNSLWNSVEGFLYKYPSQILNATYAVGGAGLIKSGLFPNAREIAKGATRDPWIAASGALVSSGALLGLTLPEANTEETEHESTVKLTENPIGWMNDKPLRWPAMFYTLNNVTTAKSGLDEMRQNPGNKSYLLKYLAVSSYIVSNGLLGASSKDHVTQSGSQLSVETLEDVAAEIIAAQPKTVQEALMHEVAEYLSEFKEIETDAPTLMQALQERIQHTPDTKSHMLALDGKVHDAPTPERNA